MLPIAQLPAPPPLLRAAPEQQGDHVVIAGQTLQTAWIWRGGGADQPAELWLTLKFWRPNSAFTAVNPTAKHNLNGSGAAHS